jgi:hypothetical protein
MEPLIIELPESRAVCFESFLPDSEAKAFTKMSNWLKTKNPPRWFEEHIKTPNPDYVIVDLFLELE